jgi:ubiquinone/menaquinone biosynthesis C-methylase UbiE
VSPTKPAPQAPANLFDRSKELAKEQVLDAVKIRYFPEIWYMIGNWLQSTRQKSVLEVGYGIGLVGEAMARSAWQVTCIDPADAALSDLKKRFKKTGVEGTFLRGEPERLPIDDGAFPAVVSINMLEFAQKPGVVLAEISRVLAPGGRAVIATFNKLSPWGLAGVARSVRPADDRRVARCLGKDEFLRMLTAQGFTLDNVYDRAAYLPLTAKLGKLKMPFAGAFVALVSKPVAGKAAPARKKRRAKPAAGA